MFQIHRRILDKERELGRLAGLSAYMKTPPPLWRTAIPLMFIFDFLARTAAQRRYADFYLIPRRSAMEAALMRKAGAADGDVRAEAEAILVKGLRKQRFDHDDVRQAFKDVVALLVPHYEKLLKASGDTVKDRVLDAYPSRSSLEDVLSGLERAEHKVDEAILNHTGDKQKTYLENLASGLYEQRVKQLDRWYWTDGA